MAEPIQPAVAAAALEPVPVRILVVIVVDILVATVADTGVMVVVAAVVVVPSHRIAVDTAVAAVAVVVAAVGMSLVEVDSKRPGHCVSSSISRFLESEQYLRFLLGENESPCALPETEESPVSRNSFGFPFRDSTLFLIV